jgi:hypothetical protein
MNVHKAICVKERYTYCFTYAVLQTCTSTDIAKLNAILNFIKTKGIKLDKHILSVYTKSFQVNTFQLLVATVKDCELIDINVLMKRVVVLDDVSLICARSTAYVKQYVYLSLTHMALCTFISLLIKSNMSIITFVLSVKFIEY